MAILHTVLFNSLQEGFTAAVQKRGIFLLLYKGAQKCLANDVTEASELELLRGVCGWMCRREMLLFEADPAVSGSGTNTVISLTLKWSQTLETNILSVYSDCLTLTTEC